MERLLNEHELDQYRAWVDQAPGTGTASIPSDLSLLLGHIDAQSAMLQRARQREHTLVDAMTALLDYVQQGGDDAYREQVVRQARAALQETS